MIDYIRSRPVLPLLFKGLGLVTFGAYLYTEWRNHKENQVRAVTVKVDDSVIETNVKTALKAVLSTPGALSIRSMDGVVSVRGDILREETKTLLSTIVNVEGVRKIRPDLTIYDEARGVPALQGRDIWHIPHEAN